MSPSPNDVAARLESDARAYQHSAVVLAAVEVGLLDELVNSSSGGCYSARELEEMLTPEWFEGWQLHWIDERTSIMVGRRSSRPLEG